MKKFWRDTNFSANDTNTSCEACPPIDVLSPAVIVGGEDGRVTTSDPAICALEITE